MGEKEQEWKDMFVLYDKKHTGSIPVNQLNKYLAAVGVCAPKKTIEEVLSKYEKDMTFNNIWNEFKDQKIVTEDEIQQAFKEFDQGGKIITAEFKYILTSLGDKMTDAQADKLISSLNKDSSGNIDYIEFMKKYKI